MSLSLAPGLSLSARPLQPLLGDLTLALTRVHEFCGPARRTLAVMLMGRMQGPVIWVLPGWQPERLYPDGILPWADPGRLILARAKRPEDMLWSAEEALRSGAAPLVVAELPQPPGLTPVRRLHLAAEAGTTAAHHAGRGPVLGVLLTPGDGGAPGVESRWRMDFARSAFSLIETGAAWHLRRLRSRMEPVADWRVTQDGAGVVRVEAG